LEILGYALAVLMGITLGLLGGGGSILSVPILVYIMGVEPVLGTAYSLFVVGSTALIGGWRKHVLNLVNWKTVLVFAIPSLIAVFLTRRYLVPAIPVSIIDFGGITLTKDLAIMIFFAVIMLVAGFSMISERTKAPSGKKKKFNYPLILLEGAVVGVVTGLVGAGGGFLIVPALILLVGLRVKVAIGTSLVIISIKSLIGFIGDIGAGQNIDWVLLTLFTGFSIIGMLVGNYLTRFVRPDQLKTGFGWFVLVMAVVIIGMELLA
jgi:uncharacterized membrane protein YfcA